MSFVTDQRTGSISFLLQQTEDSLAIGRERGADGHGAWSSPLGSTGEKIHCRKGTPTGESTYVDCMEHHINVTTNGLTIY